jgi:hypothetical protein
MDGGPLREAQHGLRTEHGFWSEARQINKDSDARAGLETGVTRSQQRRVASGCGRIEVKGNAGKALAGGNGETDEFLGAA